MPSCHKIGLSSLPARHFTTISYQFEPKHYHQTVTTLVTLSMATRDASGLQSFVVQKQCRTHTASLCLPYSQQPSSTTHGSSFPHINDALFPQTTPIVAGLYTQTYGSCYTRRGKDGRLATEPFVLQDILCGDLVTSQYILSTAYIC